MKGRNYWFKAKNYGLGWTPASWQGWIILKSVTGNITGFLLENIVFIGILFMICMMTGEKPKWRWGKK